MALDMEEPGFPTLFRRATESLHYLHLRVPASLIRPKLGVICGSGLGGLAAMVEPTPQCEVDYADVPHFAPSTVQGHAGKLVFGLLGCWKTPVVLMVGRTHLYEGHSIQSITFPIRVFKLMEIEIIIVTNAAGGLNTEYGVGDIVVLNDHINLAGLSGIHPLRGPNTESFGVRFPALSDAYDLDLRWRAHQCWQKKSGNVGNRRMHEGIYAFVGGPSYETRAECRMLRTLGADVVGMSTVPEIIVARHCGIRVLALSLVTNQAVLEPGPRGDSTDIEDAGEAKLNKIIEEGKADHKDVLQVSFEAGTQVQELVRLIVESLGTDAHQSQK